MLQLSDLPAVEELLLREGLLILRKGVPKLTNKYYALHGTSPPAEVIPGPPLTSKERFKRFIQAAEVPRYITMSGNKGRFMANAPSQEAINLFAKLEKRPAIRLPVLTAATKAYYADQSLPRKAIANYFTDGIWETVYEAYVERPEVNGGQPKVNRNAIDL